MLAPMSTSRGRRQAHGFRRIDRGISDHRARRNELGWSFLPWLPRMGNARSHMMRGFTPTAGRELTSEFFRHPLIRVDLT